MLAGPYLFWSVSFVVIPLLVIVYYAFTSDEGSFTFSNLAQITTPENLKALGISTIIMQALFSDSIVKPHSVALATAISYGVYSFLRKLYFTFHG